MKEVHHGSLSEYVGYDIFDRRILRVCSIVDSQALANLMGSVQSNGKDYGTHVDIVSTFSRLVCSSLACEQ